MKISVVLVVDQAFVLITVAEKARECGGKMHMT